MKKFASFILVFWVLAVLLGRVIGLHGNTVDLSAVLALPNMHNWLGADDLGRSILARILRGVEVSLFVAVLVTVDSSPGKSGTIRPEKPAARACITNDSVPVRKMIAYETIATSGQLTVVLTAVTPLKMSFNFNRLLSARVYEL